MTMYDDRPVEIDQPVQLPFPSISPPDMEWTIPMSPEITALSQPGETLLYTGSAMPMPPAFAPFSPPAETPLDITPTMPMPPASPPFSPVGIGPDPARRKFMRKLLPGLAAAGGAAVVGGVALSKWLTRGDPDKLKHGQQPGSNGGIAINVEPPAGPTQIGHLLRRAGFGATAAELSMYSNLGYQGAVDRLLNYQQVDDSAMEKRLQALNLDLTKVPDEQRWWLLRMAWSQRPLLEKMTLFWSGVLTSSYRNVGGKTPIRIVNQNNFLRAHAFDNFDNILLGITTDPGMLVYLNLTDSRKNHPNENYARELMELFTIGLGNYTQQDVFSGAAALTGWHIDKAGNATYYPSDHSTLPVTFLGQTGSFTYKDIIRILAAHPATPRFIGRRLFTFFAYENPSDDDLQPLVDAYTQSGHNMGAVMRALLLSPQFSSEKAYRSRIKSPIEFVIGAYRALGVQSDGQGLQTMTTLMGQPVFDPPNVAGWPGDKTSATWLNSGAWMTRLNYIDLLLYHGTFTGQPQPPDLQGIINAHQLGSPEQFVDYFSTLLLDSPLPTDRRSQVLNYFTAAGNASWTRVTLTGGKSYPLNRVRGALYLIMASPEYQLN